MLSDARLATATSTRTTMKTTIALLGQFAIANNLSTALHELGHAVGVVLCGGSVAFITLNPFCWSWTGYAENPCPAVASWSGVVGGMVFGVLPVIVLTVLGLRVSGFLVLLGIIALGSNGVYLLGGALGSVGDGADILRYGAPRFLPVAAGVLPTLVAAVWFIAAQPRLGIPFSASFAKRTGLLLGSFGTYLLIMLVYVAWYHNQDLSVFASFAAGGIGLLVVISIAATWMPQFLPERYHNASVGEMPWRHAIGYVAAGICVVVAEIAVFGK